MHTAAVKAEGGTIPLIRNVKKYEGVLLDIDNVLVDTEWLHCEENRIFFGRYGVVITRDVHLAYWIREGGRGALGIIHDFWLDKKEGVTLSYARAERDRIYREELAKHIKAKKGAVELLHYLREKEILMAAVTSNYRSSATASLKTAGLFDYIAALVASEDVEHQKPHPEPYEKGAELLGFQPEACVAVEDSPKGIKSARRAKVGLVIRLIDSWTEGLDFSGEAEPDLVVTSLEKIIKLDLF